MLLLSTGVIGRRIKLDALVAAVPALVAGLGDSAEDAHHAAVAITTTDLVSKSAALEARLPYPRPQVWSPPWPNWQESQSWGSARLHLQTSIRGPFPCKTLWVWHTTCQTY